MSFGIALYLCKPILHKFAYMYTCINVCMYVCMYECMYVHMFVCTHVCLYVYVRENGILMGCFAEPIMC